MSDTPNATGRAAAEAAGLPLACETCWRANRLVDECRGCAEYHGWNPCELWREDDDCAIARLTRERDEATARERAAVVAYLRRAADSATFETTAHNLGAAARMIERGAHLAGQEPTP